MTNTPSYSHLTCACGHRAYVATSRWLHRDEMLRRARCTVCGKKAATDVTMDSGIDGMNKGQMPPYLVGLKVIAV